MRKYILPLILVGSLAFGECKTLERRCGEVGSFNSPIGGLIEYEEFFPTSDGLSIEEYKEKVNSSASMMQTRSDPYENQMTVFDPIRKRIIYLIDVNDETSILQDTLKYDHLELILVEDYKNKKSNWFIRDSKTAPQIEKLFNSWEIIYNMGRADIKRIFLKKQEEDSEKLNKSSTEKCILI